MLLSAIFLAGLAAAGPRSLAVRQTPTVKIEVITATLTGTGCPPGSYSVSYILDDPEFSPNKSGFSVGFDEPFFVPLRSDKPQLDKELKAGRTCNAIVKLRYPVGCSSTTVEVTHHGMMQMDPDARASFARSYSLSRGTTSTPQTLMIPGGTGEPLVLLEQNDSFSAKATVGDGSRDVTFTIDLATEISSANRATLDSSYLKMEDFTAHFTVDTFSNSC